MDSKELRGLMEAYSEVYAPEQLDEALTGERYKKVMKKPGGTAYSRKVSADPSKRATRGGRGGESDFGAGDRGRGNKAARRAGTYQEYKEELDIFDVVLEFLQAEGYAETLEEAEWMMANMIDEEAIGIILGEEQDATPIQKKSKYGSKAPAGYMQTRKPTLQQMSPREKQAWKDRGIGEEYMDEAQVANRDPEKYEREQAKKSAPVRGERTPMPPRGDKRREDFEKWYAKQMGR